MATIVIVILTETEPKYCLFEVTGIMTLVPYDPDRLDKMALRVFDLCARIRKLANNCRSTKFITLRIVRNPKNP